MKDNFQKQFGENFKRIRKAKKLTQDAVAERSGMSPSYISEVETGSANPTLSTTEKLAEGLGVGIFDLFGFLYSKATPKEIRERMKAVIDATDTKGLKAIHDAVLDVFKPPV